MYIFILIFKMHVCLKMKVKFKAMMTLKNLHWCALFLEGTVTAIYLHTTTKSYFLRGRLLVRSPQQNILNKTKQQRVT